LSMHTPYFPAFRQRLANLGHRRHNLRQQNRSHLEWLLAPVLPPGLLAPTDEGANSRDRVFSLRRTFFAFLYQVLNPGCSCREVVRQVQALFALHNRGPVDEDDSAYCQARQRLPLDRLQRARVALAAATDPVAASPALWHGLQPKVVDATTSSLPDTYENQQAYPQSATQKPGCGFPLLKLVGIFSLATGALLDYAKGNKHQSELRLLRGLLDHFRPGDLLVADRGFCTYVLAALLRGRGIFSLLRLHHSRSSDLRRGKRLGKCDRLWTWKRPNGRPPLDPPLLVEENPRAIVDSGPSLQPLAPGLSAQVGDANDHLTGPRPIPRRGHCPTLRSALENRIVVSRY